MQSDQGQSGKSVTAICGNLIHLFYGKPLVFAFDAAMVGVGMMHMGFMFKKRSAFRKKIERMSQSMLIIGFVTIGVLIFINVKVNMREGDYGIIPLFWVNAIGSSILLWVLSCRLEKCKSDFKVISGLFSSLKKIGKRSLTFLCLNQVIIYFVFTIYPVSNKGGVSAFIHNSVALVIVLCILYIVSYMFEIISSCSQRTPKDAIRSEGN